MERGFLNLISEIQHLNWATLWSLLLLAFIRMAPIVTQAPFLGARLMPAMARVGMAFVLSLVFLPNVILHSTHTFMLDWSFIGYSVKELLVGFILGYLIAIPFYIAQSSGILIDYLRGSSAMISQDATLQVQASPIGNLMNYYLIVLFYAMDGPLLFFDAINMSFSVLPADTFLNPQFFSAHSTFWHNATTILATLFRISIQLAAPPLVAILMAESFLGIANRLAPQIQIAFLGLALKSLLGLILLWTGWAFITKHMGKITIDWVNYTAHWVAAFSKG